MVPDPFKNRLHRLPYFLGTFGKVIVHKTKDQRFSGTGNEIPAEAIVIAQCPGFGKYIGLSVTAKSIFQGAGDPARRE